jgi:hypothetical protein
MGDGLNGGSENSLQNLAINNANNTANKPGNKTNLFSCFSTQSIPNLQLSQTIKSIKTATTNHDNNLISPTDINMKNLLGAGAAGASGDGVAADAAAAGPEQLSLLDWIKSTDPNNKLNCVIEETNEILANLEKNLKWNDLHFKINKLLNQIENNAQMREIEGLTKRLDDLKGFLIQSNKFLIGQNEINDVN